MADLEPQGRPSSQQAVSIQHPATGVVVVVPQGEIDVATAPGLEDRIEEAERENPRLLIIDLNELLFMDSSGLRVILSALKRANETGRLFALVCDKDRPVHRLLEISGVAELVRVASNVDELIGPS